jgi:hypothetical protein
MQLAVAAEELVAADVPAPVFAPKASLGKAGGIIRPDAN